MLQQISEGPNAENGGNLGWIELSKELPDIFPNNIIHI
jgi:hypothetical protein